MSIHKHVPKHQHIASEIIGDVALATQGRGDGTVDWMNVPWIKVLGNAFFEDLTQLECTCPSFTWAQLEPYIWGFDDGVWTPSGLELEIGDAKLRFKDITDGYYFDVGVIRTDMDESPILWFSHAVMCKKDFFCGGFVSSAQGALFLGSGLEAEGDMPQIILSHSEVGYGYKNILEINTAAGALANLKVSKIYVDYLKKVNGDDWDFLELDAYDYATLSGIHFGSGWGDIYHQTVGGIKLLEISGIGVIIDGYLNVASVASTGQIGIAVTSGAPLSISSTTVCANLNADLLDGNHASAFLGASATATDSDKLDGHHWSEIPSGWNGGTIANNITINNAGAAIEFYDFTLYRQTTPSTCLELDVGMIIDGALNVAGISCNGAIGITAGNSLIFGAGNGALAISGDLLVGGSYLNINPSSNPVLNLQISDSTKAMFGHDGSNCYINVATGNLELDATGGYVVVGSTVAAFQPYASNMVHCGNQTKYWNAVWAKYLEYHTGYYQFDALDDLELVKNYKTKMMKHKNKNGEETDVAMIDDDSLPHLLDEHGFHNPNMDIGFLLGCIKQLVNRVETLEKLKA